MTTTRRVLVTGSEGYIGSVLMPLLHGAGWDATGLDAGWFMEGRLVEPEGHWSFVRKDVRDVERADLEGCWAVVHLAALSNDPLGELDPDLTLEINYRATVRLAELAKNSNVERFVFSSSCSMYGKAGDKPLDEEADFAPQTVYARSKVLAERELARMAAPAFSPVFLRNATAYGISPRQRFDLVLPNLAGFAQTTGEVRLMSDGTAWRPLVHIRDIAQAVLAVLAAPRDAMHNQAFNIGRAEDNYQIRDLAQLISQSFPGSTVKIAAASQKDTRDYRVSFAKAATMLPAFRPSWTVQGGVRECAETFKRIGLSASTFQDRLFTRLSQIRYLREHNLLDEQLRSK